MRERVPVNRRGIPQNFSPPGVASPFFARTNIESEVRSQPPSHKATASQGGQRERTTVSGPAGVCQPCDCLSLFVSCLRQRRDIRPNASATRAVPLARLDVVDWDWRRRLPGPPFPAAQSSRNGQSTGSASSGRSLACPLPRGYSPAAKHSVICY